MFKNYIRLNELKKVQTRIKDLQEQRHEYIYTTWKSYAARNSYISNEDSIRSLSNFLSSWLKGLISYEDLTNKLMDYKINPEALTELGHYLVNYGEKQKYVQLIDEEIETLRRREKDLKKTLGIE